MWLLAFSVEKLNRLTPVINLRPQAIASPFCCFLAVAPLSVSLPAEQEPGGYAENKIRYSNMSTCSPTSPCVFQGQPSSIFSACELKNLRQTFCVCVNRYKSLRVTTKVWLCVLRWDVWARRIIFSPWMPPGLRFPVTVNKPSIQQRVINKRGRRGHRRPRWEAGRSDGNGSKRQQGAFVPDSSGMCVFMHVCVRPFRGDVHVCASRSYLFAFFCITLSNCFDICAHVCAAVEQMRWLWCYVRYYL